MKNSRHAYIAFIPTLQSTALQRRVSILFQSWTAWMMSQLSLLRLYLPICGNGWEHQYGQPTPKSAYKYAHIINFYIIALPQASYASLTDWLIP